MVKEKFVSVCPVCNSVDIRTDNSNKLLESFGSSVNWVCNRCGNSFPISLEIPLSEAKDFKEKPLTDKVIHSTPTKARVGGGYVYAIIGILFVVITVILILANIIF